MTANASTNEYKRLEQLSGGNFDALKNVTEAIKKEFSNSNPIQKSIETSVEDCNKILSHTTMTIKMYANSAFKKSEFLEISEIDRIKSSLAVYLNKDQKVEAFKNELLEDLTDFQQQIKTNHTQKIVELTKQKQQYERELNALKSKGYKPKKETFLQIVWSTNAQEQEHARTLATTQAKIEQLSQKLAELQQTRPLANAKDILLYRMYMKEKYSK